MTTRTHGPHHPPPQPHPGHTAPKSPRQQPGKETATATPFTNPRAPSSHSLDHHFHSVTAAARAILRTLDGTEDLATMIAAENIRLTEIACLVASRTTSITQLTRRVHTRGSVT